MAARRTSKTTLPEAGLAGSGTLSIRTSRGPWKTAALTPSALDLDLHVPARVTCGVEGRCAVAEREGRGEQRRRIDPTRGHEPNRARPHPGRSDDPADLECFRLDKADFNGCGATDV